MQTYDTHAHIDHLKDIPGAMQRAHEAGVIGIIAQSMDLASCHANLKLQEEYAYPPMHLGLGMHPSEAKMADVSAIIDLIHQHKERLSHVGEIGLDFWYKWVRKDQEKKDEQRAVFRAFLECAKQVDLPVVVHSRGCWRECFETLQDMDITKAEFHWYSGPLDVLEDILNAGYFVSATPSLAKSEQAQAAIAMAPITQTFIETDCPVYDLEPKDVFQTLQAYCDLKVITPEDAIKQLNINTQTFFGIETRES